MVSVSEKIWNYGAIAANVVGEWGAVNAAKWAGRASGVGWLKSGSKAIPLIGNLVTAADDIYQQYQINCLKDTASGLLESQGILKGQMEEVIAGINEGKLAQEQIGTELNSIKDELANNSNLTKNEIDALKAKQEYFKELAKQNAESIEYLSNVQIEFTGELKRNKEFLEIISDKTELNEKEINKLRVIVKRSNERFDNLEKSQAEFISKMNEFDDRLNSIEASFETMKGEVEKLKAESEKTNEELLELQKQIEGLLAKEKAREDKKLAKQREKELASKLDQYYQLKEKKKELEAKLKGLSWIPSELPNIETELNLKPKLFSEFANILKYGDKEAIITNFSKPTIIYPITAKQYTQGLTKFGAEVMQYFEVCEDGKISNKPLPTPKEIDDLVANFNQLFFNNAQIKEEDFIEKQNLINKLKSNVQILNEMAQELGFSNEEINENLLNYQQLNKESGITGATASQHLPMIVWAVLIFLLILRAVFSDVKDEYNKLKEENKQTNSNEGAYQFLVYLALITASLLGLYRFLFTNNNSLINNINKDNTEEIIKEKDEQELSEVINSNDEIVKEANVNIGLKRKLKAVDEERTEIDYSTINETSFHSLTNDQKIKYLEFIKQRFINSCQIPTDAVSEPKLKKQREFIIIRNNKQPLCWELNCQVMTLTNNKFCKGHNCEEFNCSQLKACSDGFYHKYCISHLETKSYDKLNDFCLIDEYQTLAERENILISNLVSLEILPRKQLLRVKHSSEYASQAYLRNKELEKNKENVIWNTRINQEFTFFNWDSLKKPNRKIVIEEIEE